MQPFTLDQTIITALLFVLGILIGMYFLAGRGKWRRLYTEEAARSEALSRENERLGTENREYQSLRHAADRAPVASASTTPNTTVVHDEVRTAPVADDGYRRVDPDPRGGPDVVIRRP